MKKGIIFDVDGTLWDACAAIADSWNIYTKEQAPDLEPRATEEMIRGLCGQTMDRFAAVLFPGVEKERAMGLTDGCCEYEVEYLDTHPGDLYPDVKETLTLLKQKYPLYIVSNCQSGYVEVMLRTMQLEGWFEDIEYYGRTLKPKAENIKLLYERNALDAAVYIGDTQGDCLAASRAGVPFIHAEYGFGAVDSKVPSIGSLRELPELVENMLGK